MRIKQSEIKVYREKLLKEQNNICPLCKTKISKQEATLDHDHETGKSVKYSTVPVTKPKEEYYLGLTGPERKTLKSLLEHWLRIGPVCMMECQNTQSIYRKVKGNLPNYVESLSDLNHQQPSHELRQELQECRKRLNEVEDKLDDLLAVGEMLI